MEKLSELIQQNIQRPTTARCERDTLIDDFLARLNPSRKAAGYEPFSASRVLGDIKRAKGNADTETLRNLYKQCAQARNFGKLYTYLVKPSSNKETNH